MIGLSKDEKIYLVQRRHRIVLMKNLFPELLLFLALIVGTFITFFIPLPSWPPYLVEAVPALLRVNIRYLLLFIASILLLLLWTIIFLTIVNYYLDCWIVTNKRTIYTELQGLFDRFISSVPLDKIQDITIDIEGILPNLFNFGDIHVQTAGEFREFVFRQIPNPVKTKRIIFEARREYMQEIKKRKSL